MNHFEADPVTARKRAKDLYLPDGRTMEFGQNVPIPTRESDMPCQQMNNLMIYRGMASRGVIFMPEIEATTDFGKPRKDHIAYYVDKRIGKKYVTALRKFVIRNHPGIYNSREVDDRNFFRDEIETLLDQGMEETGVGSVVARLRSQNVARPLGQIVDQAVNDHGLEL